MKYIEMKIKIFVAALFIMLFMLMIWSSETHIHAPIVIDFNKCSCTGHSIDCINHIIDWYKKFGRTIYYTGKINNVERVSLQLLGVTQFTQMDVFILCNPHARPVKKHITKLHRCTDTIDIYIFTMNGDYGIALIHTGCVKIKILPIKTSILFY